MRKNYNPPIPGHTTVYGMNSQPMDDAIHRQRGNEQATLDKAKENVEANFAAAEAQRVELKQAFDEINEPEPAFDTVVSEAEASSSEQANAVKEAKRKKGAFQQYHGLDYEPAAINMLLTVLYLLFFMMIETAVNAGFLLEAHLASGPTAALTLSCLISLTNVAVSTWAGYLGRWKDYGRHSPDVQSWAFRRIRFIAHAWFWMFLLLISLFHLTVGLVRAHETLDSVLVFHTLEGYLAIIGNPHALFLVMTGAVLSGLSYQKGKTAFSDPYPGYSRYQQEVEDAQDAIFDSYEDDCDEIETRYEDAEKGARQSRKQLLKKLQRHQRAIRKYQRTCRQLEAAVNRSENRMKTFITLIAAQHGAARGDDTPLAQVNLQALSSFQNYLTCIKDPVYVHLPDQKEAMEQRKALRQQALKRLAVQFEATINH